GPEMVIVFDGKTVAGKKSGEIAHLFVRQVGEYVVAIFKYRAIAVKKDNSSIPIQRPRGLADRRNEQMAKELDQQDSDHRCRYGQQPRRHPRQQARLPWRAGEMAISHGRPQASELFCAYCASDPHSLRENERRSTPPSETS